MSAGAAGADENSEELRKMSGFFFGKDIGITWVVPLRRLPVTTRIITFLVGNPYKPSFATVTGRADNPRYDTRGYF